MSEIMFVSSYQAELYKNTTLNNILNLIGEKNEKSSPMV